MKRLLLFVSLALLSLASCDKETNEPGSKNIPSPPKEGTVELTDNLIVYTPQDSKDPIISYDGRTLVLRIDDLRALRSGTSPLYAYYNSKESTAPKKGDIIAVPIKNGSDYLMCKITDEPKINNNEMTILTAAPKAEEVIYEMNIDREYNLADFYSERLGTESSLSNYDPNTWKYDQEYQEKTGRLFYFDKKKLPVEFKTKRDGKKLKFDIECSWPSERFSSNGNDVNSKIKLKANIGIELLPILRVQVQKLKGQKGFNKVSGSFLGNLKVKLDVEAEAKLKAKATDEWANLIPDISLPPIPIYGPITLNPKLRIITRCGLSGELEFKANILTWECPLSYEAGYNKPLSDPWFFTKKSQPNKLEWFENYSIKAKGVFEPDLRVGVFFRFNNLKNLEGTLGVGFRTTLELNGQLTKSGVGDGLKISLDPSLYLFMGFEIDLLKWYNYGFDSTYDLREFTKQEEYIIGKKPKTENNLVAYYPFNGNAQDESGNGNHGEVRGATLTTDRHGRPNSAYSFDGIDDYIIVNHPSLLDHRNLTISAWVYIEDWRDNFFSIVNQASELNATKDWTLQLQLMQWGKIVWSFNGKSWVDTRVELSTNKWTHIAITQNDNKASFYLDGNLIDENTHSTRAIKNNMPLFIGVDPAETLQYTKGKIDDLRIYNKALTAEEIKALTGQIENTAGGGGSW